MHGIDLAYEVQGASGDPAVLVHGWLGNRHRWDRMLPGLAHSMQVLAYDRRGYGESTYQPRPHPVRDDAADLAGLLERLDLYPAHIIGHSYGGAVALRLAIDRPEMVRSLALHEPPFFGLLAADPATASEGEELLSAVRRWQGWVHEGLRERAAEELVDAFSTESGAWGRLSDPVRAACARTMERWAEESADPDAQAPDGAACRELLVPTLLTVGGQSPRFLHRITQDLAGLLRNHQIVELPEAGHAPQSAQPHQYVGILSTFLLERNVPVS